ncbi:MAG: hypothetical protein ACRCSU_10025 [Paracoccaceae bacterium]
MFGHVFALTAFLFAMDNKLTCAGHFFLMHKRHILDALDFPLLCRADSRGRCGLLGWVDLVGIEENSDFGAEGCNRNKRIFCDPCNRLDNGIYGGGFVASSGTDLSDRAGPLIGAAHNRYHRKNE